jgi:Family of unknown function (DUF6559)
MDLLRSWRMRRAAKQYARLLGPHLQHAYGAAEHYSAQQIATAAVRLGLDRDFIALGLAAFLPAEDFAAMAPQMPVFIPYDEARALVERFRPSDFRDDAGYYESNRGITG